MLLGPGAYLGIGDKDRRNPGNLVQASVDDNRGSSNTVVECGVELAG